MVKSKDVQKLDDKLRCLYLECDFFLVESETDQEKKIWSKMKDQFRSLHGIMADYLDIIQKAEKTNQR